MTFATQCDAHLVPVIPAHCMSNVGQSARVQLIVADYITAGLAGKFTIVGSGITLTGRDATTGKTAPLSAIAVVTFDPKFVGESPVVEMSLETNDGAIVELPGEGDGSPTIPLRIAEPNPLLPASFEGFEIPADAVRPKVQLIMQFQSGLPLELGQQYVWRVTIDGETRDEWTDLMFVPKPVAPPEQS